MGKLHRRVTRKPHAAFLTQAVGLRVKMASGDTLYHLGSTTALSDSSSGYGVSGCQHGPGPFGAVHDSTKPAGATLWIQRRSLP